MGCNDIAYLRKVEEIKCYMLYFLKATFFISESLVLVASVK